MARKKKQGSDSIYESFSDVALLTLATFVFLLVTILITSRLAEENELPRLQKEADMLRKQLNLMEADKTQLQKNLQRVVITDLEGQVEAILKSAGVGHKDFDIFIEGLRDIPGKDIHLIVDASGSMHGVSAFLIPILRVIVTRSGKDLSALTWFSDHATETYMGTMGDMFDHLMNGAPFVGNIENIGRALKAAAHNAPIPGAYVLVGDEPSDDTIYYSEIPGPVFTLALGRSDPYTEREYQTLSEKTNGKMLVLKFQ
ncbi:MAG: hypothetical protein FD165_2537 [Gammaproteobacteria bacterium]|nr:MAG: hypothetical protein FD165_2537 [Gammaproteobacteria bacterium]TND02984.1 MAG: hypothetical protein FD120_2053 [Gammaproteobacteria bacterium]